MADTCLCCGVPAAIELHHVWPRAAGGCDKGTNLVPLCRPCHELVTLPPEGDRSAWLMNGCEWARTREGRIMMLKCLTVLAYANDSHDPSGRPHQFASHVEVATS